jgi:hypothetical protein
MLSFLDRFKAEAYALLRIVSGFMFSFHGMQKVLGVFSEMPSPGIGSQLPLRFAHGPSFLADRVWGQDGIAALA